MDPRAIFQMQKVWQTFTENHPKFPRFLQAASTRMQAGTILEFKITTPEGEVIESNLRLTESDMQLAEILRNMK